MEHSFIAYKVGGVNIRRIGVLTDWRNKIWHMIRWRMNPPVVGVLYRLATIDFQPLGGEEEDEPAQDDP